MRSQGTERFTHNDLDGTDFLRLLVNPRFGPLSAVGWLGLVHRNCYFHLPGSDERHQRFGCQGTASQLSAVREDLHLNDAHDRLHMALEDCDKLPGCLWWSWVITHDAIVEL